MSRTAHVGTLCRVQLRLSVEALERCCGPQVGDLVVAVPGGAAYRVVSVRRVEPRGPAAALEVRFALVCERFGLGVVDPSQAVWRVRWESRRAGRRGRVGRPVEA